MFRCVRVLTTIAVGSMLLGACATDQAPLTALIKEQLPAERHLPAAVAMPVRAPAPTKEPSRTVAPAAAAPVAPAQQPPQIEESKPFPPDTQIVSEIVAASRAAYHGDCACPEDMHRDGQRCGRRSAYLSVAGRSPLCYPHDVSPAMIEAHRKELP